MHRRTKIVATLGPATDAPGALEALLSAGVDVARINFSHGSGPEHVARILALRSAAARLNRVVAVLADLPGPKLRAKIAGLRILAAGQEVAFSRLDQAIEETDITLTEPELLAEVQPGHRILLDDGRITLSALSTQGDRVVAKVLVGGVLHPNKGVNLPDTPLNIAAVTERDQAALKIACEVGVDWLALSFVRTPEAADELRKAAAAHGYEGPVLAKIERPEAVARIRDIAEAFDGLMVARGDLGVEMRLEAVPAAQKMVIAAARKAGKPVITATEMLESMTKNPRPTRAETSDVANAIFDGTDAVMLSGETAVGDYAVEAVACMARIAVEAESYMQSTGTWLEQAVEHGDIDDPIAQAACELALETKAQAIITPTVSGRTARRLARHRPWATIVAPAPERALRRMAVVWGLTPVPMSPLAAGDDRITAAVKDAYAAGAVSDGDRVVVLAGHPIEGGARFPTLRIVRVGEGGSSLAP